MEDSTSVFPLQGSCFCGSVAFSVSSAPIVKAYCHCTNCQRLTGCPFIHTVHFPDSAFKWTHAAPVSSKLATFVMPSKPWKTRFRCTDCGVGVASHNAQRNTWSLWGPNFARDAEGAVVGWEVLRPEAHIFYGTRMLDVEDGLGKWEGYKDISERLG